MSNGTGTGPGGAKTEASPPEPKPQEGPGTELGAPPEDAGKGPETPETAPKLPAALIRAAVLSGAEELADGLSHVGIAVMMTSGGKPSTLVISDVGTLGKGAPVYITKPVFLRLQDLTAYLKDKVTLPPALGGFMEASELACDAFYYSQDGPLLIMFSLTNTDGIIASLTGDDKLGKLFDVNGGSVRIFRCSKEKLPMLQAYAAELTGPEPAPAPKLPAGGTSAPATTQA